MFNFLVKKMTKKQVMQKQRRLKPPVWETMSRR